MSNGYTITKSPAYNNLTGPIAQIVIAVMIVGGTVAFSLFEVVVGRNPMPPDWMTFAVGAVLGYYYAERQTQTTANVISNGITTAVSNAVKSGQIIDPRA